MLPQKHSLQEVNSLCSRKEYSGNVEFILNLFIVTLADCFPERMVTYIVVLFYVSLQLCI